MDWFLYDNGLCHERVNESEIYKLLKNIDDKATGIDKILPTLVTKSAATLSKPLCDAVNNSFATGIFREGAKVVSFCLTDKGSENENKMYSAGKSSLQKVLW